MRLVCLKFEFGCIALLVAVGFRITDDNANLHQDDAGGQTNSGCVGVDDSHTVATDKSMRITESVQIIKSCQPLPIKATTNAISDERVRNVIWTIFR